MYWSTDGPIHTARYERYHSKFRTLDTTQYGNADMTNRIKEHHMSNNKYIYSSVVLILYFVRYRQLYNHHKSNLRKKHVNHTSTEQMFTQILQTCIYHIVYRHHHEVKSPSYKPIDDVYHTYNN